MVPSLVSGAFALASLVTLAIVPASLPVPARAETSAAAHLYFPNVTKTLGPSGWTTSLVIQSVGPAAARPHLRFYRFSDGALVAEIDGPILQPGQSWLFDPRASASLPGDMQLSAVLEAAGGRVAAVAVTGSSDGWMSYAAPEGGARYLSLPRVSCQPDGWTTPLIVQNVGEEATGASVAFYGDDGTAAGREDISAVLPGRSTVVSPCAFGLGEGTYSAVVSGPAGARLAALVNEHRARHARSYVGFAGGAERVYLPNVTKLLGGAAGWSTPFLVENVGESRTTVRLAFRALGSGELVRRTEAVPVEAGRRLAVDVRSSPTDLPAGQYSVVVEGGAGARLVALVDEAAAGKAMEYAGIADAGPSAYIPFVEKRSGDDDRTSPVIAQNAGHDAADLTVTLFDANGTVASRRLFRGVEPGAAVAYDPGADPRLAAGRYSALVQSAAPVAAVVNHSGRSAGDDAFAFAGTPGAAAPLVAAPFPYALETVGGIDFVVVPSARADLYVQLTALLDAASVARRIDAAVGDLEADFARAFAHRPQLYLFASSDALRSARGAVLGDSNAVDPGLGVFIPGTRRIGVDWSRGDVVGLAKARHELTHLLVSEIVRPGGDLPTWLNEGLARLEEYASSGGAYLEAHDRYDAVSMAASGRLFTLEELTPASPWFARVDAPEGRYEYAAAAQAVRFLRDDIGAQGLLRLLARTADGTSVSDAYGRLTGRPFDEFARTFTARVAALARGGPGIVAVPGPGDEGSAFLLYGFPPSTALTYSVTFNGIAETRVDFDADADAYGRVDHFVSAGSLPGPYTITVMAPNVTLSFTASLPARAGGTRPARRVDAER